MLDSIEEFIAVHGYAPTLSEIADAVGLSSISTVHSHVKSLVRKGWLRAGRPNSKRYIELVHCDDPGLILLLLKRWHAWYRRVERSGMRPPGLKALADRTGAAIGAPVEPGE